MFGVIYKKSYFSRLTVKNVNLTLPRFTYRSNWESESAIDTTSNSFRQHKSNGGHKFGKQASVENHVFRGKSDCLDFHEIAIT